MSWYNALELSVERRLSHSWTFAGAYTWSKALSTNNSSFTTLPSQPPTRRTPTIRSLDKALSAL